MIHVFGMPLGVAQWSVAGPLLNRLAKGPGRPSGNNRRFLHAILWMARAGAPWRGLPAEFGHWRAIHARFLRWARKGVWRRLFAELADSGSVDWVSFDSVSLRPRRALWALESGAKAPRQAKKGKPWAGAWAA